MARNYEKRELEKAKVLISKGYSAPAVAMNLGYPVGSEGYYDICRMLGSPIPSCCGYCGQPNFGTGDCNCHDD